MAWPFAPAAAATAGAPDNMWEGWAMNNNRSINEWVSRYGELEATCRLWVAANQVKDARIKELEHEVSQLRQHLRHRAAARGAALQRALVAVPNRVTANGGLPAALRGTGPR